MELSIHHTAIIASDYQAAKAFYAEKLGLPVLSERYRPERGDWKIDLRVGDSRIELFVIPNAPPRPSYPEARGLRHLAFRVSDITATVRELEEKGIPCEPVRTDPATGCRFTFFRDPDGLPLELYENQG